MKKSVLALAFLLTAAARLSAAEYVNGVFVEYFSYKGTSLSSLPDFSKRNADLIAIESDINHAGTTRAWEGLDDTYKDTFASRHRAFIEIPASGLYTFSLESDDGSALFIDGSRLILNDGVHAMARKDASIELEAGLHDLRVDFFENGGDAGLRLYWASAAFAREIVPAGAFWIECQDGFDYGLDAEFFDCSALGSYSKLPSVIGMESVLRTTVANVRYPSINTTWPGMPEGLVDRFNARFTGFINIEEAGDYTFYLNSDDGSFLYIDGEEVVANDGSHSMVTKSGTRHLEAGLHRFRIEYAEFTGGAGLLLDWEGPGFSKCPVPSNLLLHADDGFDADGDGMSDRWEIAFGLDPDDAADAERDLDGDGISNREEFESGLDPLVMDVDPDNLLPGLWMEAFSFVGESISSMPDFKSREADFVCPDSKIWYEKNKLSSFLVQQIAPGAFATRHFGFLLIEEAGEYSFKLRSDDGSRLYLDGAMVIDNNGIHSARDVFASSYLEAGYHPIEVDFFDNGGDNELKLAWSRDGNAYDAIPHEVFFRNRRGGLAPFVAISAPLQNAAYGQGRQIQFSATAEDADGEVVAVEFFVNGVSAGPGVLNGGVWKCNWSDAEFSGMLNVVAVATDNEDLQRASDPVTIEVVEKPAGYAYGLMVDIYPSGYWVNGGLSRVPNLRNSYGVREFYTDTVNYQKSGDSDPWPGFSWRERAQDKVYHTDQGTVIIKVTEGTMTEYFGTEYPIGSDGYFTVRIVNKYAASFRGVLLIPEAGEYELTLDCDDGAILYLDDTKLIDGDGCHSMSTYSKKARLSAGLHKLEINYFENTGDAGLILSWSRKGQPREVIPAAYLLHEAGVIDTDGDGMPDWWENQYGLDPTDASDARLDNDNDGVSNLDEFNAGTNPLLADTDGDGMPDGWEKEKGTCPFVMDGDEDRDGDQLSNIEEYLALTNPGDADTDGDGYSDYVEVRILGTDAIHVKNSLEESTIASIIGTNSLEMTGSWTFDGISPEFSIRGGFETRTTIDRSAVVEAVLNCTFRMAKVGNRTVSAPGKTEFLFYVDGEYYGKYVTKVNLTSPSVIRAFTPCLPPGEHRIGFFWNNLSERLRMRVAGFEINSIDDGVDGGTSFEDRVAGLRNNVREVKGASYVSPMFVEGGAKCPWLVKVNGEAASRGAGDNWFYDLQLDPATNVECNVSFEGGTYSVGCGPVEWKAIDLESGEVDSLSLRAGDSIRVGGMPAPGMSGKAELVIDDVPRGEISAGEYRVVTFDSAGLHRVRAEAEIDGVTVKTRELEVECIGGSFPEGRFACMVDRVRNWKCPNLPENCTLESDDLTEIKRNGGDELSILTSSTLGRRVVVARTEPGGPIFAKTELGAFWTVDCPDGDMLIVGKRSDYEVWYGRFVAMGAPEGVSFSIVGYGSAVLNEDFSMSRSVPLEKLNAAGCFTYKLLKPDEIGSACHLLKVYQNGSYIGEAGYGKNGFPEEMK